MYSGGIDKRKRHAFSIMKDVAKKNSDSHDYCSTIYNNKCMKSPRVYYV